MEGYVRNATPVYAHALKRAIAPNGMVPLDDLYAQYGKKHGLAEGEEFVNWLRNVKLKDRERWSIVYNEGTEKVEEFINSEPVAEVKKLPAKQTPDVIKIKGKDGVISVAPSDMSLADVVNLSVRQAREVIPKITNLKLLKYAIQEANQLANKDSLCIILRKRIKEIEVHR